MLVVVALGFWYTTVILAVICSKEPEKVRFKVPPPADTDGVMLYRVLQ